MSQQLDFGTFGGYTSDMPTEMPQGLNALIDALTLELQKLRSIQGPPNPLASTQVLQYLREHPGDHRREIAQALKLHPKTVSKALEVLAIQGAALRIGERRGSRWFLVETLDKLTTPKQP